jgi:hypothetical protein
MEYDNQEYTTNLIKRFQVQRNEALNQVALLETELIKAQYFIEELNKKIKELSEN